MSHRTPGTLRMLRILAGLRQADLARKAGCCTNTIARLERGEHRPQLATAQKIAAALNASTEVVFPP